MKNKLLLLPDLGKRPKHKPKRRIIVNSFATSVAAMAEKNSYHGPQLVKENGKIDSQDDDDYDPIEDLLEGLAESDYEPDSYPPLHLVTKKDDCHKQSPTSNKPDF